MSVRVREGDHVIIPEGVSCDAWAMEHASQRGFFEMVGARQAELLMRARCSRVGAVKPANHLERRALKRLSARTEALMRPLTSHPDVWQMTMRGRYCWLKVRS